ncbi:MAG: SUMF1/EgtB/PvdO family nonheme iron enzyme [Deltaproteobacteria bacterium]|nr:SUMF1/EgtB/PvdO family nonheme iron enzyme [Deltaproteobacteria bacterium]
MSEVQWEYAASAGGTRTYPWGDREPTCEDANFDPGRCGLKPDLIAQYPPSPEGVYDLAGNGYELVVPDWKHDGQGPEGYPAAAPVVAGGGIGIKRAISRRPRRRAGRARPQRRARAYSCT